MSRKTTKIQGVRLISDGDMVVRRFEREGDFEPEAIRVWREAVAEGGNVIDVGAYSGIYSLIAAMTPGVRVFAFEPNPTVYDRLVDNVRLADKSGRVICFPFAASDREHDGELFIKGGRSMTSAGSLVSEHGPGERVRCIRLDLLNLDHVRAIKIDAERAEPMVIAGAMKIIRRSRPLILTEILGQGVDDEIHRLLDPLGYRVASLGWSMYSWTPEP